MNHVLVIGLVALVALMFAGGCARKSADSATLPSTPPGGGTGTAGLEGHFLFESNQPMKQILRLRP